MMKLTKRTISLLLALTMVLTICLSLFPTDAQAASFTGVTGPTLVKRDGVWYYVKNGAVCYDRTLVKYSGAWWFVKDGKVASNLTTLVKYTNEWWYVVKGKIASNTTSLVKYNNEWWYVVKGKIAAKTTTLVKYNGSWYYIVKGKMAGNTTGFVNYGGAKYYVKNGVMQSNLNGKVTVNGGTYFVKNGALTNCHSAGHSWKAATCTAPKTCTKCALTEGTALGHNYGLRGIIVEATCTTDGEKDMACTRCWDSYTAVIKAPGHNYVDGWCTWCDRPVEPTFMLPEMPIVINEYNGSGNLISSCEITGISLVLESTYRGKYDYTLILSGTSVYSKNGNYVSENKEIGYKIYDSNDVVFKSGTAWTNAVSVGEKFVDEVSLYDLDPNETYRIVLLDVY